MQPHRRILARCRTRGRLSGSMRRCSCSRSTTHRRATPTPSISSRHCRAPLGNATDRRANASIVVFVCCGAAGACCLTRCGVSCCCVLPTACRIWCEMSRGCACCIAAAFGTAADAARQQLAPLVRQAAVQRGRKCVPPDLQQRKAARLLSSASCSVQRYSRCRTAYAYTAVWHRSVRTQA